MVYTEIIQRFKGWRAKQPTREQKRRPRQQANRHEIQRLFTCISHSTPTWTRKNQTYLKLFAFSPARQLFGQINECIICEIPQIFYKRPLNFPK